MKKRTKEQSEILFQQVSSDYQTGRWQDIPVYRASKYYGIHPQTLGRWIKNIDEGKDIYGQPIKTKGQKKYAQSIGGACSPARQYKIDSDWHRVAISIQKDFGADESLIKTQYNELPIPAKEFLWKLVDVELRYLDEKNLSGPGFYYPIRQNLGQKHGGNINIKISPTAYEIWQNLGQQNKSSRAAWVLDQVFIPFLKLFQD